VLGLIFCLQKKCISAFASLFGVKYEKIAKKISKYMKNTKFPIEKIQKMM